MKHFTNTEARELLGAGIGERIVITERDYEAEARRGYVKHHTNIYKDSVVVLEDVWQYGDGPSHVQLTFRRLRKRDGRPFARAEWEALGNLHGVRRAECPECGSNLVREDGRRFKCEECGVYFIGEDLEWKSLRDAVSVRLMSTDEVHPFVFNPCVCPTIWTDDPEIFGLSSLDLPRVDKAYQAPGDGGIFVHIHGEDDACWHDIEEPHFLDTADLGEILRSLEKAQA